MESVALSVDECWHGHQPVIDCQRGNNKGCRYNSIEHVEAAHACIRTEEHAGKHALCVMVGNTRSLWRPFLEHCRQEAEWLKGTPDPLDSYCEQAVLDCVAKGSCGRGGLAEAMACVASTLCPGPRQQNGRVQSLFF
jgi:hypothetical protein